MNILYHFRVRGTGVERVHIAGIAGGFRKLGHHVEFVSPSGTDPAVEPEASAGKSLKTRVLHACADFLPQAAFECMEILYPFIMRKKLENACERRKFDFIYERYAFFNTAGVDAAGNAGIPLILEVNELSGLPRVRSQSLRKKAAVREKYILDKAQLIVTVSNFLKDRIVDITNRDDNVMVVPNGVSRNWLETLPAAGTAARLRRELDIADTSRVLGFCGGLTHWHNFEFMLEVFKKVGAAVPDALLLIVGDGPMRAKIREIAVNLGIIDKIRMAGNISHSMVRDYLQLFDVAFIPHSNEYRSPVKLFEYMGAGRAVVASDTEPIRQVVSDGVDGMLFSAGDTEQAACHIASIMNNKELSDEMGKKALSKIASGYLWEQHAERIIAGIKRGVRERIRYGGQDGGS